MSNEVPTRDELRAHLVASRIAGDVGTPRENNLRNIGLLARGDPQYLFGLTFGPDWDADRVLKTIADRVGISPDPDYRAGPDRIDPDRTLDRLDAMADRLLIAAPRRERGFVAPRPPPGVLAAAPVVGEGL